MGFIVEIIQNISAFVGQKVSTISTAISGIGEFFGGDFFTDLLAFFAVPFVLAKSFVLTVFSVIQKTTVDAFNSLGNFWEIIKNSLVDFGASISLVFQLIKNNVADLFAGLVVSLANSITAGKLFVEALAKNISDFGALVFSVVKDSLTGFPYAVSATVIAGLLLAVVLLMLTEKILVVFDALDLMVIKKNVKQFFGKTIIKQRAEKQATPIVMPNVQPISFAQAFVVVSFLAFLAYSLPQKYQLASLSPWLQRSEGINSDAGETSQDGGYQGNMNLTPTEILGETTQETLSLLAESNPNLYQLLNAGVQRRSNATSLQLGMITINPQGQIFLLPKSISSREIKNYVIKNIDIADHAITSRTIKNHTIRSIDLQRDLTIEELKIDHNLTVRGNLITEGSLTAVDMNLLGNLDLRDNLILNIGNTNTDFTTTGGLNLAGNLNINNNFLANATTGNITAGTYNGNTITNGTGTLTLNEHTLTLTNNTQLNQNLLTTSTPQFARLGLGVPADATNILTATSSSTTDLSKTLNISHTGISTGTGYAGYFSKTGTSTTNVGLYTIATGATNNYALQVDSAVVGATNYTIYANGVAKNYFAGNIGIGDAAPGTNLSVIGNAQIGYASSTTVSAGTALAISGNIGIGTTGPGYKLNVAGDGYNLRLANSTNAEGYNIGRNVTDGYLYFYGDEPSYDGYIFSGVGGEKMRIQPNGNVGIGTTGPSTSFHIAKINDANGSYNLVGNSSMVIGQSIVGKANLRFIIDETNIKTAIQSINYGVGLADLLLQPSGGNVGIGTTAPSELLHIKGNETGTGASLIRLDNSGTGGNEVGLEFWTSPTTVTTAFATGRIYGVWTGGGSTTSRMILQSRDSSGSLVDTMTLNQGNVGIGTTGPGAKLDVLGTARHIMMGDWTSNTSYGAITIGGTLGTDASFYSAGADLYINRPSGFGIHFRENNGVDQMTISTSGNVGIGTTSPGALLDIAKSTGGIARLTSLNTGVLAAGETLGKLEYYSSDTSGVGYGIVSSIRSESNALFDATANSGANLIFATKTYGGGLTDKMTILGNGNVGIGTTGPGSLLEIKKVSIDGITVDLSNDYNMMVMKVAGTKKWSYRVNGNDLRFYDETNGSDKVTFQSGGNVGIGTTNPGTRLWVQQSGETYNDGIGIQSANGSSARIWKDTLDNLAFSRGTNGAAMVLSLGGNLGIGQVAPGSALSVNGGISAGTYSATAAPSGGMIISGNVGIGTTSPGQKLQVGSNGDGSVAIANAWSTFSDENFKTNIQTISGALDKINLLRGVTFDWKNSNQASIGFIAQEIEKVFPEMVSTGADGYKSMDYSKMTPVLLEGIKEQQLQITGLSDNQNKIVEQLTNQLSYQLADKTISIDTKINLIGASLDELNQEQYDQQIKKIKGQIEDNTGNLTLLDARLKLLETVLTLDSNNLKVIGDISANNLTLSGKLDVDSAVAGAFAVKVSADKPKTIGEAYICPAGFAGDACDTSDASSDGKSILVQTSAVSASAKIFVTPENDTNGSVWVEKKSDNSGFKIMLKPLTPILEKIKINWWIVEKISD